MAAADYQIDCLLRLITSLVQERISKFFYDQYEKSSLAHRELAAAASASASASSGSASASAVSAAAASGTTPPSNQHNSENVVVPKPLELFQSRLSKLPRWIEANLSSVANQILGPNRADIEKHCGYALGLHLRSLRIVLFGPSALSHEPFAPKSVSVENFIFHLLNNLSIALIAQPFLMDMHAPPKERANNVARFHLLVRQQIRDTFNLFAVTAGLKDPSITIPPPPAKEPVAPPPIALCSANRDGAWEKIANVIKESHNASLDHLRTEADKLVSTLRQTVSEATATLVSCIKENPIKPAASITSISASIPASIPASISTSSTTTATSGKQRDTAKVEGNSQSTSHSTTSRTEVMDFKERLANDQESNQEQSVGLDEGDEEERIIRHISQQGGFTHPTEEEEQS